VSRSTTLADRPGFDCGRASSRTEKTVCTSEVLRIHDAEMSAAYERVVPHLGRSMKSEQRAWLNARDTACRTLQARAFEECLLERTAARERYLHNLLYPELRGSR
jgi:uncharacterized protein YecT (DUF1311 family)